MKTNVIAEIGSNWERLSDIMSACEFSVKHGCIPKLQAWVTDLVVNKDRYPRMYEVMKQYELPRDWIKIINKEFPSAFYSVFDLDTLWFLEAEIKPQMYKIASPDAVFLPLLRPVARLCKPTLVSIGGCTLDEVRKVAKEFRWDLLTLLECNASYPAKNAYLGNLRDRINGSRLIPWGYSDHTTSVLTPALAVTLGATVIEKHFKDREYNSPDNRHSLGKVEFLKMLDLIKESEENLATLEHPYPEEEETLRVARRKEDGLR